MEITARSFRAMLATVAALLALAPASVAAAAPESTRTLTVLHTNDLHARLLPDHRRRGGFATLAAVIRRESVETDAVLVLDAGDMVQGTPVSSIYRGVPIYEIANLLGIDVSILGNHEFDYGWRRILDFREAAAFPIVSANVMDTEGELLADGPFVIREINGIRVAIVGLLTTDLPHLVAAQHIGPWRVEPPVKTLERLVPEIRAEADLIVALGHLTEDEEDAILSEVTEVSVVVSGHSHHGLAHPKRKGERLVVRVKAGGTELGRLDLVIDPTRRSLVSSRWRVVPVDSTTPEAEDVAARVAFWESNVSAVADVPIGRASRELSRAEVQDLVERVMLDKTGADLAYLSDGETRDVLPAGRLMARHAFRVMPFEDRIVVVKLKGGELPAAVAAGHRIEPDRLYTLAVTDFTAAVNRALRSKAPPPSPDAPLLRDLIIDWIREREVLD